MIKCLYEVFLYHVHHASSDHDMVLCLGNQGTPNWARAQVPIMPGNINVVFEGVRGNSFRGDIAIDDVTVKSGTCAGKIGLL